MMHEITDPTSKAKPLFTVFTPTFNRSSTLRDVYHALCRQTLQDFEWLIVDDGSSDGTRELVQRWMAQATFPIRYFYQENAGKPSAHNRAVTEARGDLFVVLDSDDTCLPNALERFATLWSEIPAQRRRLYSGITVLCVDNRGAVIGKPFPASPLDGKPVDLVMRGEYRGDKWGFHRTAVLREFPFPIVPGERHVPEGLVWNRVAARFLMRFVNEPLRVVEYRRDGLSVDPAHTLARSPRSAVLFYLDLVSHAVRLKWRLRAAANAIRYSCHGRLALRELRRELPSPLFLLAVPIGLAAWLADLWRWRRR